MYLRKKYVTILLVTLAVIIKALLSLKLDGVMSAYELPIDILKQRSIHVLSD